MDNITYVMSAILVMGIVFAIIVKLQEKNKHH